MLARFVPYVGIMTVIFYVLRHQRRRLAPMFFDFVEGWFSAYSDNGYSESCNNFGRPSVLAGVADGGCSGTANFNATTWSNAVNTPRAIPGFHHIRGYNNVGKNPDFPTLVQADRHPDYTKPNTGPATPIPGPSDPVPTDASGFGVLEPHILRSLGIIRGLDPHAFKPNDNPPAEARPLPYRFLSKRAPSPFRIPAYQYTGSYSTRYIPRDYPEPDPSENTLQRVAPPIVVATDPKAFPEPLPKEHPLEKPETKVIIDGKAKVRKGS